MTDLNIEPRQAMLCGDQIRQSSSAYNAEIKKLYNTINDLKSAWKGTAAKRYTDNVESFKAAYEEFGELIDKFGELLVSIGKDYQYLEENL